MFYVHCSPRLPVSMLVPLCLSVCIITAKTFTAFISQHCIKEQRDKRCKHISSSKPYAFLTADIFHIIILYERVYEIMRCIAVSPWIVMHGLLCIYGERTNERVKQQKSTLFLCFVLCFSYKILTVLVRALSFLPLAMCKCSMQLWVCVYGKGANETDK